MSYFTDLASHAPASTIRGVNGTAPWREIPGSWKSLILKIVIQNNKTAKYARRGLLYQESDQWAVLATGMPVRSSHGNVAIDPPPYDTNNPPAPVTPLQKMWFMYAEQAKTFHCPVGRTPAYIEFTVTFGEGASRLVWDYMNNIFLATDHYNMFFEVTNVPTFP